MLYQEFETRWAKSGGAERANYGLFLQDLCDLLGVPRPDPTTDRPAQDAYVLERAVLFEEGGGRQTTGRIDLYKRGCFILETKQGTATPDEQAAVERAQLGLPAEKRRRGHAVRGTSKWEQMMKAAQEQALRYVRALPPSEPRPPFVVVVDVGYCFDVYSNFAGVGDTYVPFPDAGHYRFFLPALASEQVQERLRLLFTDPQQLDPGRRAAQVTRRLAGYLAGLSSQLEAAGHAPDTVAQFLMRVLFTMFAEDVELIPADSFSNLLTEYATEERRPYLPQALQSLWATMDTGGFAPALHTVLRRFNGKLFHDATALPLNADQITLLQEAAKANWTEVEPAIFGTLLERALDPKERHSLGAHYTPRRYVERLVLPTVIEPLRREWAAAQAASAQHLEEGKGKKAVAESRAELLRFLRRLTQVRILDPACGSGNFLYVTLEHLKRLEGEVLAALGQLGQSGRLELGDGVTVGPRQLLGMELNPRAAAIADVVLRIGYLQWHLRTHGLTQLREPLLDDYQNIRQQDAVLTYEGPEFANAQPADWPAADFIVGNPPFLGDKAMRKALGDGYVNALRKAYKGQVPESADLVMYWWEKAAEAVRQGQAEALGFITTNSIVQTFNRRIIQKHLEADPPLSLTYAVADHPWVDNAQGAAVRIALSVARAGKLPGTVAELVSETATSADDAHEVELREQTGTVNADFTVGANLDRAELLRANEQLVNVGVGLYGAGFMVTPEEARLLGLGTRPGLEDIIKPYLNGRDLSQRSRGLLVIDLFGLQPNDVIARYPEVYQRVVERVKPERDKNNRASYRTNWWIFGEARSSFRPALKGLARYIATTRTARHRIFSFVGAETVPDAKLVVVALEDAFYLGVLSSRQHQVWAAATGGWLGVGNDATYNHSDCFLKFPFPTATVAQQTRIRELAETLDAHRKRQQALHPTLTLTDLYNVVEKLRAGQDLTPKEQATHEAGLAAVVVQLHRELDEAIAAAYGWPLDLPDTELLVRLVQLNQRRAEEEEAGTVRYLRPEYQAPGQQAALALPAAAAVATAATATEVQAWPAELAQQMLAIRSIIQQAGGVAVSSEQVAGRFRRVRVEKVRPLLDTLAMMALVRRLEPEGTYAA